MKNWNEVYNWIVALSAPENYSQYKALKDSGTGSDNATAGSRASIYSDAALVILNSNMRGNHQILFKELFPTSLSGLTFSTVVGDVEYITADATFRFTHYTYEKI